MRGIAEDMPRDLCGILRRIVPVWCGLLVLLAATVVLARVPMQGLNGAVSLGIAVVKAGLVAVVFMRLRQPDPLLRLAAMASLMWIGFLFALTFGDLWARVPMR